MNYTEIAENRQSCRKYDAARMVETEKLDRILEALSLLVIKMRLDMHTLLDRYADSGVTDMDILLVSAYWSEELERRAQRLRRQGNSVTWLPIQGRGKEEGA